MRLVEAIVAANHAAVEGRRGEAEFHCYADSLPLAALTCIDPRLNALFPGSLGLKDEQFIWLRNAGNVITSPTSSTVRSIAMAIYLKGAREIVVIGHTDCRMAKIGMAELLELLQAHGISRGALPIANLHEFFGLFSSEKPNVIKAVGYLRTSPVIPPKTPVHGLLIDTNTGRLEWVINGYEAGGLPLETQGAAEDLPKTPAYASGPVKSLGVTLEPLTVKEWKPITETRPAPPTVPKPPPIPKPASGKKPDLRRR